MGGNFFFSPFDLLKYRKLARTPKSSPPTHPLATAAAVVNEDSSMAGVTVGARDRSTVCRLVTSSMIKPLLFESVVRNSPLLIAICSDTITCSGVMPSTLTVYDNVTPDRSLRPLAVVVMSVTNASGTPRTEITLDNTALAKSTFVVSTNSTPIRVWVERMVAAFGLVGVPELVGELPLALVADGRNVGLFGFLVGLPGFRVGMGVGSWSGVVGRLVGWRLSSDPVGCAEVALRVGLRVGVFVVGGNVGATEGLLMLGDGVGLLEYPLVTAPRARKVASIFP